MALVTWFRKEGRKALWRLRNHLAPTMPLPRYQGDHWLLTYPQDELSRCLFCRDDFERQERAWVRQFLLPGMVVLDVGANLGLYTCLAAKRVGPTGQVHAFEPVDGIFRRLRRNLEINRLPGVIANQCCVAAAAGARTITVCGGDRGAWSSLAAPGLDVPLSREEVEATTLDGYVAAKGLTRVDLLKLDVEGAELEVLQGGADLLSRDPRPLVLCEIEDVRAEAFGLLGRDTAAFLAGRGYRWHEFGGRPGVPELSPIPVLERYPSGNYLGVPEERAGLVARWLRG